MSGGEVIDSYLSGLIGGAVGAYVGQPFDTVKVRLQVAPEVYNNSISNCCRSILKNEGLLSFWRGVTAPLAGMIMINGIVFGVEGHVMKHFKPSDNRWVKISQHFYAGAIAGLAQCAVCCPTELIKCRMQVQEMKKSGVKYDNVFHAAKIIAAKEGTMALFNGWWMTVAREVPSFAVYFGFFYWWETHPIIGFNTPKTPQDVFSFDMVKLCMAGGTAGCVCWISSYPADVIKSRVQIDGFSGTPKYKGSMDCIRQAMANEGYRWMFRGLGPTLFRAFPTNAATFSVTLITVNLLQDQLKDKRK